MWYKQAGHPYFDIGHKPSPEAPIFLWWWDGSLHVQQTTDAKIGHAETAGSSSGSMCRGRYDPATNMISMMALNGIPDGCADAVKAKWPQGRIRVFRR